MERRMDDSDIALEMALGKIGGGPEDAVEESSESDRETPPPELSDVNVGYRGALGGKEERERPPSKLVVPPSLVTLSYIVEDRWRFIVFRRFLKDQCITRNLNFWLACQHYRQLHGGSAEQQNQLYNVANAIYVKYIKHSAPQHVQIRMSTKHHIKSTLELNSKRLSPNLFNSAQEEVWEMMEQNELRQFLTSDAFQDCGIVMDHDGESMEMVYTPGFLPVIRGGSLQQSSSEDSASITSYSTDGGSELGIPKSTCRRSIAHQSAARVCISDSEQSKGRRHQPSLGPHATKDKPVSKEDFVAMVSERLAAVAKDRDNMRKRAQEQARQQGRSYEEIMAVDWYDLPEASKYANFDAPAPGPRMDSLHLPQDKRGSGTAPAYTHFLSPCHSPMATPHLNGRPTAHIDTLAQREIQDALKDLEITNQVNRKRRQLAGPRMSSTTSSILSYTSDSGVGDSAQWTTASSLVAANRTSVQRFVEGQKQLFNQMPKREMEAHAAAIALMNSSPHPEALSHRVPQSLSGSSRHRRETNPHPFARNFPGAYSSDDSSSCFTLTSESDLFIPRRYAHNTYSESDDPHQYPRLHHRQLSRPRTTRFRHTQPSHPTPPIAEQSHTPTSQARTPHPSGPPMSQKSSSSSSSSSSVLVVYDLVDMTAPDAKRPPYAKRLPSTTHITLAEFKEKIFARKGDFRFFFKSFCEDIDDAIMEEISDDETVLPLYEGKIIGRVEKVA